MAVSRAGGGNRTGATAGTVGRQGSTLTSQASGSRDGDIVLQAAVPPFAVAPPLSSAKGVQQETAGGGLSNSNEGPPGVSMGPRTGTAPDPRLGQEVQKRDPAQGTGTEPA